MAKSKAKSRAKTRKAAGKAQELIVIDEQNGLIFESEKELSAYFQPTIDGLEELYQKNRAPDDFSDEQQLALEEHLEATLDEPDEVWQDTVTFPDLPLHVFIADRGGFHYVAVAYVSSDDGEPTFVLTHFPTKNPGMVEKYRTGELAFSRQYEQVQPAVLEGDALGDGDPLAMGLYLSMMKVRSEKDIPEADFQKYADLREDTIEAADEIWRKNDLDGNILVSFIKEYPEHETKELTYVAITQEDANANVHALLFSFPTTDKSLVDRYRQGENLQAEEISQESSH